VWCRRGHDGSHVLLRARTTIGTKVRNVNQIEIL
jgi:hypothetical protein